jgi:hypothetical protein
MSRTTFYQQNYQCWPPVPNSEMADPNSRHWNDQAQAAADRLIDMIGIDAYEAWEVASLPEGTSEHSAFLLIQDRIDTIKADRDKSNECACVLPDQRCAACRKPAVIDEVFPF